MKLWLKSFTKEWLDFYKKQPLLAVGVLVTYFGIFIVGSIILLLWAGLVIGKIN